MKLCKGSIFLFFLLIWLFQPLTGQDYAFPTEVKTYFPAPGQHINDPKTGIPDKAYELAERINSGVSLGAFGGYIIFYFDKGVENHSDNPYGVDFTIFGNSFSGSAEPGIVQVMKDENQNGLPDDIWYEIAGSLHYSDLLVSDFGIHYYQPEDNLPGDVFWTDNEQFNGRVAYNQFHEQAYYPDQQYFVNYPKDSVEFSGNRLAIPVVSEKGILRTGNYLFGYADNIQQNQGISLNLPDNPYTPEVIEGAGGNAMDISWAVDIDGNYVSLDKIHFIRIYSAVLANAGPLGEVSTDITGVVDVPTNSSITGPSDVISMETFPDKIISDSQLPLKATVFKLGKPILESLHWESDNNSMAEVIGDSLLQAKESGEISLSVFSPNLQISNSKKIRIVMPDHIFIESDFDQMLQGKAYQINAYIIDNEGFKIDQGFLLELAYDNSFVNIESSENGVYKLTGLETGNSVIRFSLASNPEIYLDYSIQIVTIPDPVKVSFSLQLKSKSIIGRSWFLIEKQIIQPFIERGEDHSNLISDPDITLSDVITQVLLENGFTGGGNTFQYRIDEHTNGKLYFWQLGVNWEYHYGWGGSTQTSFQSTWVVSVNDSVYFNDFNKLVIHNNDIISLSLVEDITQDWDELVFWPEKQKIEPGEKIRFYALKYLCHPIINQVIVVKDDSSLEEHELFINGIPSGKLDQLFEEDGKSFSLSFEGDGVYTITIEDYEEYSVNIFVGTAGINNERSIPVQMLIYPNPCSDKIFFKSNMINSGQLRIYNLQSKVLLEKRIISAEDVIDITFLNPGIYLAEIENEEMSVRKIFIKQ
jgi:plastocyanin